MARLIPVELEIADLIHAVNRRIRVAANQDLGPLGITPAQARALRVLHRAGGRMQMSELAERLRIARRSTTSVVDELVARGLVARSDDPTDRRAVLVAPTDAGAALLGQLSRRRLAAAQQVMEALTESDLATLRSLLQRLDRG